MTYLKRYSMPKSWPIGRKTGGTWMVSPLPGPHKKSQCLPIQIVLRDVLKMAENAKEANKILKSGKVLVDKKVNKEPRHPLGFMDLIEFPDIKKYYVVNISKNGLSVEETTKEQANKKLCRIENKVKIGKGKIQLNLHDGRNILVDEKEKYNTNDSVLIELPSQKILATYPMKKGANVVIVSGRNMGKRGTIKEIKERKKMMERNSVIITSEGKDMETLRDYVFLIGDKK